MVIADSGSVHPRLRGELSGNESKALFHDGSSPLTRGTLRHDSAPLSAPRFIPAYAGNSRLAETSLAQKSVHPRLRGELKSAGVFRKMPDGSSPLTRGTPNKNLQMTGTCRFIPAYAGNSYLINGKKYHQTVHPRLRGELDEKAGLMVINNGSSPLTRGTQAL